MIQSTYDNISQQNSYQDQNQNHAKFSFLNLEKDELNVFRIEIPEVNPAAYYLYLLYDENDVLLYIGQTKNILARVGIHISNYPQIKYARYCKVPGEQVNEIEAEFILFYWPPLNFTIPTNNKWICLERFQKIHLCLKGKTHKCRKAIKKLNLKDLRGYYLLEDLLKILPIVCEVNHG